MEPERSIYTVSALTRLIKSTLEHSFGELWVQGELSNLRHPSSGHFYFTIKDETSQISAVLFRGSQRGLTVQPRDGMLVRVFGAISVYERSGNYQIIVRMMEDAGQGALQARFEALKEKLRLEGLFDAERKKPIPLLPQHVGLVTSPTGAAIRDILNVVTRRFPNLHILLAPVKVQGESAAGEIAEAIDLLNRHGGLDVLIVGRGGGSLEDLWCFNEEIVARAIARSSVPVISAVGHEIDFTISDFSADLRAPTPSAAAELVVGCKDAFEEKIADLSLRIGRAAAERVRLARHRLATAGGSYVFREPRNLARQYRQRIDTLALRMERQVEGVVRAGEQFLDDVTLRLGHAARLQMQSSRQEVRRLTTHLNALSPLAVLERGYSITSSADDGTIVRDAGAVAPGVRLLTRVARGRIESQVITAHEEPAGDGPVRRRDGGEEA